MDRRQAGAAYMISRKENNHAKYVVAENQREFVAGNAAIIFGVFFPILRIADRFRVYPRLPTTTNDIDEGDWRGLYVIAGPLSISISNRRFLINSTSNDARIHEMDRFKCFRIFVSHCRCTRRKEKEIARVITYLPKNYLLLDG